MQKHGHLSWPQSTLPLHLQSRFWNLDWTIRSNQKNLKPLIFAVLLAPRTALWEKSRDPCEPWSDLKVLRTMTRPLLTVPYFPLYLNLKIKKKIKNKKRNKMDILDCARVFRSNLGFLFENIHWKLAGSFESFIVERVILFARSRK